MRTEREGGQFWRTKSEHGRISYAATRTKRRRIRRECGAIHSSPCARFGRPCHQTSSPDKPPPLHLPYSRAAGPGRCRLAAAVLLVLDWNLSPPATPSTQGELPSLPCCVPCLLNLNVRLQFTESECLMC
jgi:hypothetical protein